MRAIAVIELAPGEKFFHDKSTDVLLHQKSKTSVVYAGDDLTGIRRGLLNKSIILKQGALNLAKEIVEKEVIVPEIPSIIPPTIYGVDNVISFIGIEFIPMKGVRAMNNKNNDITNNVIVEGLVDVNVPGVYVLEYSVSDTAGNTTTLERTITVLDNIAPELFGVEDTEIALGESFDPLANVSATDNVDGNITKKIKVTKKA